MFQVQLTGCRIFPIFAFLFKAKCLCKAKRHYGRNVLLYKNYNKSSYEGSRFSPLPNLVNLAMRSSLEDIQVFIHLCFFGKIYKYLTASSFYFSFILLF